MCALGDIPIKTAKHLVSMVTDITAQGCTTIIEVYTAQRLTSDQWIIAGQFYTFFKQMTNMKH